VFGKSHKTQKNKFLRVWSTPVTNRLIDAKARKAEQGVVKRVSFCRGLRSAERQGKVHLGAMDNVLSDIRAKQVFLAQCALRLAGTGKAKDYSIDRFSKQVIATKKKLLDSWPGVREVSD